MKIIFALALARLAFSCPSKDKLCLQCRDTRCIQCAHSYPGSNGVCTRPTSFIKGCYTYSSNTVCSRCQDGYYFNVFSSTANTTCVKISKQFEDTCRYSVISDKKCTHCKNNVLQSGGGCSPLSLCADPNCETCHIVPATGLQNCFKCKEGYTKFNGVSPAVCVETPEIQNCDSFFIPRVCDACLEGYYYNNGKCKYNKRTTFKSASVLKTFMLAIACLVLRA